jgi:SAM-dependent methyltransferase
MKAILSKLTPPYASSRPKTDSLLRDLVLRTNGATLDIGSGERVLSAQTVRLDIMPHPTLSVCGDACRLPFADGVFDLAVCSHVLEHVPCPAHAVAEAQRVVRPGGLIFWEVPFLYPFHTGTPQDRHDYTRWTAEGLKQLFSEWELSDFGASVGCGTALRLMAAEVLALPFLTARHSGIYYWVRNALSWLLLPISWLDGFIERRTGDAWTRAAGGFWLLARKPLGGKTEV